MKVCVTYGKKVGRPEFSSETFQVTLEKDGVEDAQHAAVAFNLFQDAHYDVTEQIKKVSYGTIAEPGVGYAEPQQPVQQAPAGQVSDGDHGPACPECNAVKIARKVKQGKNAGRLFWSCPTMVGDDWCKGGGFQWI